MFLKFQVKVMEAIRSIREPEDGQALVEYALILALVAVAAIGALTLIGGGAKDKLNQVGNALTTATTAGP
jgi:pilus assembly protein Flp/PilA